MYGQDPKKKLELFTKEDHNDKYVWPSNDWQPSHEDLHGETKTPKRRRV